MHLSPDEVVLWRWGWACLNETILATWLLMAALGAGAWLLSRRIRSDGRPSRWQCVLEMLVLGMLDQMEGAGLRNARAYLPFVGSLFLFLAAAALATLLPLYEPPTGSLSATGALALCVAFAVPWYGIRAHGVVGYLKEYMRPTPLMAPFHLISEVTRTLALAVRLFGNMMSGALIVAIIVSIVPFVFPAVMQALGLVTGLVQSYIFSMLATVFIAAATRPKDGA